MAAVGSSAATRGAAARAPVPAAPPRRSRRGPHQLEPAHGSASSAQPGRRRSRGRLAVAAAREPERQTVTERTPAPPPPEVEVKAVGFGSRGARALSQLALHPQAARAELWCLDVDRGALDEAPTPNVLLLPKDDPGHAASGGALPPADLARLVGRAASDAGGRGNISAATDGAVTFVLAPAAGAPGGGATVLQVVAALRAAGHFTVAAVTQPFAFEGAARREQAAKLVAELRRTAHVVAVMEQDVLMQAFGDAQMTVAEATDIADTALEHVALCILRAVQAGEVLKSVRGALMWHGRDLRHFKRILPPPLQQLLTRPGSAVLGRGLASMPAEAAHRMGASQALMHLASDAVRAAAESPFLEGAPPAASGVLCCLDLPASAQVYDAGAGAAEPLAELQSADGERRAVRLAAQAAAGALGSMSGGACQDLVLCAEPRPAPPPGASTQVVQVEATLLVMRADDPPGGSPAGAPSLTTRQPLLQPGPGGGRQPARFGVGPAVPQPPKPQPQRLPSSAWGMLSAVAGGKAAPKPQQQAQQQAQQPRVLQNTPNFFGGGSAEPRQQAQRSPAAPPAPAEPRPPVTAAAPSPVQRAAAAPVPAPAAPAAASAPAPAAEGQLEPLERRATFGELLAQSSMTAQSLDMSPAAARWRQEQRDDEFQQRRLIVWEAEEEDDEAEPWEEEEDGLGLAALLPPGMRDRRRKVDIKGRMASILSQDREDAWVADNGSPDA